jgi:hypothetical protein
MGRGQFQLHARAQPNPTPDRALAPTDILLKHQDRIVVAEVADLGCTEPPLRYTGFISSFVNLSPYV